MRSRVRCREINSDDIDAIVDLLTSGFRKRTRDFWVRAFNRLTEHDTPPEHPKYGYLIECEGRPVGVLLLIYSAMEIAGQQKIRCNVSSWYAEPVFRNFAGMLVSHALRQKNTTYFNITPDPPTYPILEAQGYSQYCSGRFVAMPSLARPRPGVRLQAVKAEFYPDGVTPSFETKLLIQHAHYGCISVLCLSSGRSYPFVFLPRRKAGLVPFSYLAYCRSLDEFVWFAGPLGRFLTRRGFPLVVLDANGPIPGLVGWYSDGARKYFKGPDLPRLGDMAFSERVMFGF